MQDKDRNSEKETGRNTLYRLYEKYTVQTIMQVYMLESN